MENLWKYMLKKIVNIHCGLLRFKNKNEKVALSVEVKGHNDPSSLHVVVKNDECPDKLINHDASFIQKTDGGYLFVSGHITSVKQEERPVLSLNVMKSQLFVRKAKGHATWFEETCMYEQLERRKYGLIL